MALYGYEDIFTQKYPAIKTMKDVSIEYAHIYTNDKISKEHELSLETLSKCREELDRNAQSFVLTVLVDDYSFPDPTFDYDTFTSWLTDKGFKPDIIFRESQLIPLCDEVLKKLKDDNLHEQLNDYIKSKKYPCSLFISAWYLLRLGRLRYPSFNEELYASRLINILPKSFKPFEDKAIEIISATEFAGAEKMIEYSFIEGRLIA